MNTSTSSEPGDAQQQVRRPGARKDRRDPTPHGLLRRALSTPRAARQAFLLREVLGPPVSLRSDEHNRYA